MIMEIEKLKKKFQKIEQELEKVRGCSVLSHGWQTQKYAKASRKWDELSKEKFNIQKQIEDYEAKNI